MFKRLLFFLCCAVAVIVSCQATISPPTLQPGEVEVPFETVVLDEEGVTEITQGPQLFAITTVDETVQLQTLISTAALQQMQQIDFVILKSK